MSLFRSGFDWKKYSTAQDDLETSTNGKSSPYLDLPHTTCCGSTHPFKAPESDTTSLSMKKRHHHRHSISIIEGERASGLRRDVSDDGGSIVTATGLPRSRSFPSILSGKEHFRHDGFSSYAENAGEDTQTSSYQRRWTLPSKAASTRGLAAKVSVFKQRGGHRQDLRKQSPAMITLRRATDGLDRGTSITFFPPPNFTGSRPSLMSYFLGAVAGNDQAKYFQNESDYTCGLRDKSINPTSSLSNKSRYGAEVSAVQPTITEVGMDSTLLPFTDDYNPSCLRRCSTRYITEGSIYEVIWDENDTPSVSSSSTPRQSQHSYIPNRRQSAAVIQLETQLFKSAAQSRRTSAVFEYEPAASGLNSSRRKSFQSMLNSSFSRLINESALRNLPRSRAAKAPKRSIPAVPEENAAYAAVDGYDSSIVHGKVDFFPPLKSSRVPQDNFPNESQSHKLAVEVELDRDQHRHAWTSHGEQPAESSEDIQELPRTAVSARNRLPDEAPASQACTTCQSTNDDKIPLLDTFRWEEHNT